MESRRQQQFPPLLQTQAGGHPVRQHLPLPPPHMAMGPRPSSFSGGPSPPLSGHKRSNMALYNRPLDTSSFSKLFVGSLPRNISEEEVREVFSDFGNILEVNFLKDKKTGMSQGCCFIKYSSVLDAERAIRALDNQRTLKGASEPLQVKFADGDRDHSGPNEHKLFVGSVSRQASEQDIEEIFAPYGRVENVYVIRNEIKQSKGCAFVSYPEKEMAFAAISALDGVYRMAGCHQPLIVRFADPKRPRSGEGRMGIMGTSYSPHSHHHGSEGPRGLGGQPMRAQSPGFGWRQSNVGSLQQSGLLPLGTPGSIHTRGGLSEGPSSTADGRMGSSGNQASSLMAGQVFSGTSPQLSQQQGPHDSPLQRSAQAFGNHQVSSHQQSLPPSVPHSNQMQPVQGMLLTQSSDKRGQQVVPVGHFSSAQLTPSSYGTPPVSHHQSQQQFVPSIQQSLQGLGTQQLSMQPLHQQTPPQSQQPLHQQTPSQSQQPLHQQTQSQQPLHQQTPPQSQQPFMIPLQQGQHQALALQPIAAQLQQPLAAKEQSLPSQMQQQTAVKETMQQQPYMQPSQMSTQQPVAVGTMQPTWSIPVQQQVAAPLTAPTVALSTAPAPVLVTCDWTEHTSPEGHKYYYNSSTGESRWEKPEEFAAFEKQKLQQQPLQLQPQQQQQQQQPQHQSYLPQQQDLQMQAQLHAQQLQPQLLTSQYQLAPQQNQSSLIQPYTQTLQAYQQQQQQPQVQQLQQQRQLQLQQPQLQHLHQQQPQQQHQQVQPVQHQSGLMQQPQPQTSAAVSSMPFVQSTSGATYQPVQSYPHVHHAVQQQLPQSQQVVAQSPAANGTPDLTRVAQWVPAAQQALPNQDWMWKSKPMGS